MYYPVTMLVEYLLVRYLFVGYLFVGYFLLLNIIIEHRKRAWIMPILK